MRRILALAALVAFMPATNAQEKAQTDTKVSGEWRMRYILGQNPSLREESVKHFNTMFHRFKVDGTFKPSDKLTVGATVLHNAYWGHDASEVTGGGNKGGAQYGTPVTSQGKIRGNAENLLTVNQAWLNWAWSDETSIKVGRMQFQVDDGYMIGTNDFEGLPYAFEGAKITHEAEFGRFQLFGFKIRDWMNDYTSTYPAAGTSASFDPEHNMFGLAFDLKTMPEWIKSWNVTVSMNSADAMTTNAAATSVQNDTHGFNGQDMLHYGTHLNLQFGMFNLQGWYAANQGKMKHVAAGTGALTEFDASGSMYQVEASALFKDLAYSRVWVRYHQDSGDKDNTDDKTEGYDPYFYEMNPNAGYMNLMHWGNLTYLAGGFSFMTSPTTQFGLQYFMHSRTESGANSQLNGNGSLGLFLPTAAPLVDATKDELGNELSAYAYHAYDNGLSLAILIGMFEPGSYYKNALGKSDDTLLLGYFTAKQTF